MADAVGAEHAFFSTCGSSLSVKAAAMLAVAGHDGHLVLGRDVHKSVVAGLVFSGFSRAGCAPSGMPDCVSPTRHRLSALPRRGSAIRTPRER